MMAPKIKFALKFGEASVRTVEELKSNFNVKDLLAYHESGRLRAWLEVRGFEEERKRLDALIKTETMVGKVTALVKVFGISESSATVQNGIREVEAEKRRQEEEQKKVKKAAVEVLRARNEPKRQVPSLEVAPPDPKAFMKWRGLLKKGVESTIEKFICENLSFETREVALLSVDSLFKPQEDDFVHILKTITLLVQKGILVGNRAAPNAFSNFLFALKERHNALAAVALWLKSATRKRCQRQDNTNFFTQWAEMGDFLECLELHKIDTLLSGKETQDFVLGDEPNLLVNHSGFLAIALYVKDSTKSNCNDEIELDFGNKTERYYLDKGLQWLWESGSKLAYFRRKSFTHGAPKYYLIYVEF